MRIKLARIEKIKGFGIVVMLVAVLVSLGFLTIPVDAAPPASNKLEIWSNLNNYWSNSTINGNYAAYKESDSAPYRIDVTNFLTSNTANPGRDFIIRFQFDYAYSSGSSKHFFDYLTSYDRTALAQPCRGDGGKPNVTPCDGVTPTSFPIVLENSTASPFGGNVSQPGGNFTVYNGHINSVTNLGLVANNTDKQYEIKGTADSASNTVYILFGVRLAAEGEWGYGNGAATWPGNQGVLTFYSCSQANNGSTTCPKTPDANVGLSSAGVVPTADLSITGINTTPNSSPVNEGSTLTYNITVKNNGTNKASGISVSSIMTPTLSGVTGSSGNNNCTVSGATLNCPVNNLNGGSSATVTVQGTVPTGQPLYTAISSTATVSSSGSTGSTTGSTDQFPVNNTFILNTPTINLLPISLSAGGPPVDQGQSTQLSGSATDPEGGALTYSWDLDNNGSFETSGQTVTFANTTGTTLTPSVSFRACDSNNGCSSTTTTITVNNVAPTVTPASDQIANAGFATSFALGTFGDPGSDSPWAVSVNWGDGTANTNFNLTAKGSLGNQSHTYATAGTYVVTETVTDKYGGVGTANFNIVVSQITTSLTLNATSGTYGGTVSLSATLTATANGSGVSGKTINFSLLGTPVGSATTNSSGVATLANVSLSGINAGTYSGAVTANFTGDNSYIASTAANDLTVNKANQTISFGSLASKTYGDAPFTVSATATSGLAVSFAATGNCTISGNTVTITTAGSCTITASQPGDTNYNAATDVSQSFTIAKAAATVTLDNASLSQTYDGTPRVVTVASTSPAGLNVVITYNSSPTPPTNAGSYSVVATINDQNYQGSATGTLAVSQATATVTLGGLSQFYDGTPKQASATTDPSGLNVSFTYNGSGVAPTNAGSYVVVATVSDTNYQGSASGTLNIAQTSQTINFAPLADKVYGDTPFMVSATASSGLPVSFTASGNCTVSGNTVTITGVGSCTVTASQPGNTNYSAATDVPQSFNIAKASATVTIDPASLNQTYDGTAKSVTATTNPAGLNLIITYDDGVNGPTTTPPTEVGSYTVTVTVSDPNYQGSANGTLVISPPAP